VERIFRASGFRVGHQEKREVAYREVQMWEILIPAPHRSREVRSRGHAGNGSHAAHGSALRRGGARARLGAGEHEPDEALALEVYRAIRPGSQCEELGGAEKELLPHRAAITEWLQTADPLRLL
jgi:hypothetical protein